MQRNFPYGKAIPHDMVQAQHTYLRANYTHKKLRKGTWAPIISSMHTRRRPDSRACTVHACTETSPSSVLVQSCHRCRQRDGWRGRGRIDSRAGKETEKRSRQVSRQGKREITRRPEADVAGGAASSAVPSSHRRKLWSTVHSCVPPGPAGGPGDLSRPASRAWRGTSSLQPAAAKAAAWADHQWGCL